MLFRSGTNGTGKTAVLLALTRLFGGRTTERTVEYSDFHIPPGTDESTLEELSLWVEATVTFPSSAGVPECFRQIYSLGWIIGRRIISKPAKCLL